jgi:preprotein translocase subunit SecD
VNERVAIVVDGTVASAPTINPGTSGRTARISGTFVEGQARGLAAALNVGEVLPVGFLAPEPSPTTTSRSPTP